MFGLLIRWGAISFFESGESFMLLILQTALTIPLVSLSYKKLQEDT
jgi:hypothetical protein